MAVFLLLKKPLNMAKQQTFQDLNGNVSTEDEMGYFKNKIQLAHAINMSDITSEKGSVFEINNEPHSMQEDAGCMEDFFCDESLIKSLSIGVGNGMFDDDENSTSDDDAEPFVRMARKMEDVSGDRGVLKSEMSPGIGSDIPSGAVITFHYNAFIQYCDEPFDSTYLRKRTERKTLDGPDILTGMNIALKTMRKNETARFLIKPEYAFGKIGCPPRIPGGETLLYEIHIVSFVDAFAAETYEEQNPQCATFQEKLEGAKGYHRKGNDLYREGNFVEAKNAYTRAAWIMEDTKLKDSEEEKQRSCLLMKVRSNLAQVFLDLKEPGKACTQCKLGLGVVGYNSDEIKSKLYYRFGKAKMMLCDFDGSLKELKRAQRLRPNNLNISEALESLLIKKQKYEKQEKVMYRRMFQPTEKENLNGNREDSVKTEGKTSHNSDLINVRPAFKKVVDDQILEFSSNPNIKELPFPSNLSQNEIAYIAAVAKGANMLVTVRNKGLKIMKK